MTTPEIETVKKVYEALNRNEIRAMLEYFDPQIERVEPEGFPSSGTYRGLAEFEAHCSKARETWAEGSCEPERFIVAQDKVIAFVFVRVRLKNGSDWLEGRLADGFTFKNGKITFFKSFTENQQALAWAGVKES